jgi:hypothetical protein
MGDPAGQSYWPRGRGAGGLNQATFGSPIAGFDFFMNVYSTYTALMIRNHGGGF